MILAPYILAATVNAVQAAPVKASGEVYACRYFRNEREAGDGWVSIVDMRIVERPDGTWTVEMANEPSAIATAFRAQFGSVGRSLGLRWQDKKGNTKTAYISFSDVAIPSGIKYFWLSFDRPSLWKTPGYGCQSQGDTSAGHAA